MKLKQTLFGLLLVPQLQIIAHPKYYAQDCASQAEINKAVTTDFFSSSQEFFTIVYSQSWVSPWDHKQGFYLEAHNSVKCSAEKVPCYKTGTSVAWMEATRSSYKQGVYGKHYWNSPHGELVKFSPMEINCHIVKEWNF